jgi:hypothetical protein
MKHLFNVFDKFIWIELNSQASFQSQFWSINFTFDLLWTVFTWLIRFPFFSKFESTNFTFVLFDLLMNSFHMTNQASFFSKFESTNFTFVLFDLLMNSFHMTNEAMRLPFFPNSNPQISHLCSSILWWTVLTWKNERNWKSILKPVRMPRCGLGGIVTTPIKKNNFYNEIKHLYFKCTNHRTFCISFSSIIG